MGGGGPAQGADFWLDFTNIGLGVAVVVIVAFIVGGILFDAYVTLRRKRSLNLPLRERLRKT